VLARNHDVGLDARRAPTPPQVAVIAGWRRREEGLGQATARAEAVRLASGGDWRCSIDVTPSTKFLNEITWLGNSGVSTGWNTPGGKEYRPFSNVERNAMAAFLYRFAGSPAVTLPSKSPFADVSPSSQFYKEIVWASQQGISRGWLEKNGTQTFRPYEPITRAAMAAFLYRSAGEPAHANPAVSPFLDITPSSKFYKEIAWLADTGITTGWSVSGGKEFRSKNFTHRDAMAAFLYRYDRLVG